MPVVILQYLYSLQIKGDSQKKYIRGTFDGHYLGNNRSANFMNSYSPYSQAQVGEGMV
jgi:hypothetical protein